MKTNIFSAFIALILCTPSFLAQVHNQPSPVQVRLPNGWSLSPAGTSMPLGDLPLNMVFSASHKLLAVTNNGQSDQVLQLLDPQDMKQLDSVKMKASWLGLCFSSDEKSLYVSGGNTNTIIRFDVSHQKLMPQDTFVLGKPWPELISPAGLCLDESRNLLYVVTKESNSLYFIDRTTKQIIAKYILGGEGYTCLLSPDKKIIYSSCWGCACIKVFDLEKKVWKKDIPTGDHPNDMCMTRKGNFLFVANSNDNSVSVIDLHTTRVVETLNAALYPASPSGSTTNSVALSEDEQTLYVANADNNCLALFDVSKPGFSRSKGFIPTGWYPTCVRVSGKDIYVANGKGFTSLPNPLGPNPTRKEEEVVYQHGSQKITGKEQYIGGLFQGTLSKIPVPDANLLGTYSFQVYRNTPFHKQNMLSAEGETGNPIPRKLGEQSPIKHVFYIIKENRTYDQILGDVKQGNGDTSLVLFGQKSTPNQHALVNEFVLYDNFYVDGEVSADGHNWSTGAYATDYLEKTWPTYYGGRGGEYESEGHTQRANNKLFIWDVAKKANVTYRT